MNNKKVYQEEHTLKDGSTYSIEIDLYKTSILTIKQRLINGDFNVTILCGEELRALKKMLESVK